MNTRLLVALGLVLAACDDSTRKQTPSVDSGSHDSSSTIDGAQSTPDSAQPTADAALPDGPQDPPVCGLVCNPSSNAGCSGGMTCSAWSTNGTYGAACYATPGTSPEFQGGAFHTCHPAAADAPSRCPLGTYCDDGLEVCLTICDPASGGTPLYPNSPSTSWAVLGNPSCAQAYGDDCKIKDYLHNYEDICLPYCTNVL
jgi:hypothetical protein